MELPSPAGCLASPLARKALYRQVWLPCPQADGLTLILERKLLLQSLSTLSIVSSNVFFIAINIKFLQCLHNTGLRTDCYLLLRSD